MIEVSVWVVFLAALFTAICTGLGALPLLAIRNISSTWIGIGNAIAAGLMLGASVGLIHEATQLSLAGMFVGLAAGAALIQVVKRVLPESAVGGKPVVNQLDQAGFRKMLLIMIVMTAHSFAEGIGVGVSFGGREGLGGLISGAIAIHNIPEGLAIALVMVPRGVSVLQAAWWGVFSSLPQPLMAVPAFLFVKEFEPFLPTGLGLAAGAMLLMVFQDMIPEASVHVDRKTVWGVVALAAAAMLGFQALLG